MLNLAKTIWPRSGGDRRNSSKVDVEGPCYGKISNKTSLETDPWYNNKHRRGGVVIVEDGTLRIAHNGVLSACTMDGQLIWNTSLRNSEISNLENNTTQKNDKEAKGSSRHNYHSLPVAVEQNHTLITLRNFALLIDANGTVVQKTEAEYLDDSDLAPNITYQAMPVLTSVLGSVCILNNNILKEIGTFGYDIVPVAVFDDDSLAISGYSHKGFCRVKTNGEFLWQTSLTDADMLPAINKQQFSVVGSLNDQLSTIFSPEGEKIGNFSEAAKFAEYVDGGWIAFSANRVSRLKLNGKEIWSYSLPAQENTKIYQPIVDITGKVYFVNASRLICLSPEGSVIFEIDFEGELSSLSMLRPGLLGCIANSSLILIE